MSFFNRAWILSLEHRYLRAVRSRSISSSMAVIRFNAFKIENTLRVFLILGLPCHLSRNFESC